MNSKEFQKLSSSARALLDDNDDYGIAGKAKNEEKVELEMQHAAVIEKTVNDCETKLEEVQKKNCPN